MSNCRSRVRKINNINNADNIYNIINYNKHTNNNYNNNNYNNILTLPNYNNNPPIILNRSVHNLTNIKFNDNILYLLGLNLKFCPAPKLLTDSEILNDFNSFARTIRLKYFFYSNKQINFFDKYKIKNPSYMPQMASSSIENYLYGIQNKLSEQLLRNPVYKIKTSKYTKSIYKLIKECNDLKTPLNILFIPSDKNLGITIVFKNWYINECYRHLNDIKTYIILPSKPDIILIYLQLKAILIKYNIDNNSNLYKYLLQNYDNYKIAKFKLTIKIHKTPITGRPIVNNISSPTYYTSKHLHDLLFPLLHLIPSYIQDSNTLILKLNNLTLPNNNFMFTADVESLYPSIPIQLAITYVKRFLLLYKDHHNYNIEYIIDLLNWVLVNNIISFNEKYYLQIFGIAMGTPIAVALANIFLCILEYDIFENFKINNINLPILFYRYIDDLIGIFHDTNSRDKLIFMYNNAIDSIKITHNINNTEQIFLDLCLFKGRLYNNNKHLDIKLYQKPLNKNLYLPPHSFHTSHMFKGFILSNFNRIRFKCTNDNDFYYISTQFIAHLYNRGYQYNAITNIFKKTSSRESLINHYNKTYGITTDNINDGNIINNNLINSNNVIPIIFKTL